jgi:hypothetical protein
MVVYIYNYNTAWKEKERTRIMADCMVGVLGSLLGWMDASSTIYPPVRQSKAK